MKPPTWVGLALGVSVFVAWAYHRIMFDPVPSDMSEGTQTARELADIRAIERDAIDKITLDGKPSGFYRRDAHPSAHGCVQAWLQVNPDVDPALRHGVFARPGRSYPVWIRFSNGLFSDDNAWDARGMAMKLMGVPGEKLLPEEREEQTQDFVMIDSPTFPVADVGEFREFFHDQVIGAPMRYFIWWNPFRWRLRELRVGLGMLFVRDARGDLVVHRGASPVALDYYSMLPYKLGPGNIKFSAMACDPAVTCRCEEWDPPVPEVRTSHYLRDALVDALTRKPRPLDPTERSGQSCEAPSNPECRAPGGEGCEPPAARFAFRVQRQIPGANMPIEDASVTWSERASPYVSIAEIRIPAQRFDSQGQNEFCENLSFSPWHALPEHRPVGGLNRARRALYATVSKARHGKNETPRHEPRGFCLRLDGTECPGPPTGGSSPP